MTTRGIRANNPLNLMLSSADWQGLVPGADASLATFSDPTYGLRAAALNLQNYIESGVGTWGEALAQWAPAGHGGNDPAAYAQSVQGLTGLGPETPLTWDWDSLSALLPAMAQVEQGSNPWGPEVYDQALTMAGVPRGQRSREERGGQTMPVDMTSALGRVGDNVASGLGNLDFWSMVNSAAPGGDMTMALDAITRMLGGQSTYNPGTAGGQQLNPWEMYAAAMQGAGSIDLGQMQFPPPPGSATPPAAPNFDAVRQLLAGAAPPQGEVAPEDEWLKYIFGMGQGAMQADPNDVGSVLLGAGTGALGGYLGAQQDASDEEKAQSEAYRQFLLGSAEAETGLIGAQYGAETDRAQIEQQGLDRQYDYGASMAALLNPDISIAGGAANVTGVRPDGTIYASSTPLGQGGGVDRVYNDLAGKLANSGVENVMMVAEAVLGPSLFEDFKSRSTEATGAITLDYEEASRSAANMLLSYGRADPALLGEIMLTLGYAPNG